MTSKKREIDDKSAGESRTTSSMSLAISRDDAKRMLEASRLFNAAINRLQVEDMNAINATGETTNGAISSSKTPQDETKDLMKDGLKAVKVEDDMFSDGNASGPHDHTIKDERDAGTNLSTCKSTGSRPGQGAASSSLNEQGNSMNTTSSCEKDSSTSIKKPVPLPLLLLKAAQTSGNQLLRNFVKRLQADPDVTQDELETSLLLFLDLDKSSKLLTAFRLLDGKFFGMNHGMVTDSLKTEANDTTMKFKRESDASDLGGTSAATNYDHQTSSSNGASRNQGEEEMYNLPKLNYASTLKLFKSLLTSISTCIHYIPVLDHEDAPPKNENEVGVSFSTNNKIAKNSFDDSPSSNSIKDDTESKHREWMLSSHTKNEINDIAIYAADRLLSHVVSKQDGTQSKIKADPQEFESEIEKYKKSDSPIITFEVFGEWYNSGGFNLVPWLELLDLEKWDFAGRAAAASAVTNQKKAVIQQHQQHQQQSVPQKPVQEKRFSEGVRSVPSAEMSEKNRSSQSRLYSSSSSSPNLFLDPDEASRETKNKSRTIVSFDFRTPGDDGMFRSGEKPFQLTITEENLQMLKDLVKKSGLSLYSPEKVASILVERAEPRCVDRITDHYVQILHRDDLGSCVRKLVPDASRRFSPSDLENFSNYFTNFFSCFAIKDGFGIDEADAKSLAVGFSFLCSGNKSSKLSSAFDLLDDRNEGYLTTTTLTKYLQSFLTMLVGISLLSSTTDITSDTRKMLLEQRRQSTDLLKAVENGAKWTFNHFYRVYSSKCQRKGNPSQRNMISFEDFAEWYTEGGYSVAPWLELLDLNKFLSLLENQTDRSAGNRSLSRGKDENSSKRNLDLEQGGNNVRGRGNYLGPPTRSPKPAHSSDILFTFPLARRQSLIVLREDASYVRSVVTELGLLSLSPEQVWNSLYSYVRSYPPSPLPKRSSKHHKSGSGKSIDVDQKSFLRCIENIIQSTGGRKNSDSISSKKILGNFFQSFDLEQVNRVAANQLMGGLTLLCGGKKSSKLSFAFGLFDGREEKNEKKGNDEKYRSLNKNELFYFLRSFLIVMFSCCKQSLDLSADVVSRNIYDAAHMVAEDVMRYQWHTRRREEVDFDEFGEWYNEGGFETAPWLELLDLNKWVLQRPPSRNHEKSQITSSKSHYKQHIEDLPDTESRMHLGDKSSSQHKDELKQIEPLKTTLAQDVASTIDCPPPPPDDAIDPHSDTFFSEDMDIDGMDDMGFMFPDGCDKENRGNLSANDCLSPASISRHPRHNAPENRDRQNSVKNESQNNQLNIHPPSQPQQPNSLNFHLITHEKHNGYMISISQRRVRLLKHLVMESDLFKIEPSVACDRIISRVSNGRRHASGIISKDKFDAAMRSVIATSDSKHNMSTDTQRLLSDLLSYIFKAFHSSGDTGGVDTREIACGFTVLCGGRKSDKLEYAFELMDKDNDGLLSRSDMVRYLFSFLTVLLSISSCPIGREPKEQILLSIEGSPINLEENDLARLIHEGSTWATAQVFNSSNNRKIKDGHEYLNFDDFADWYTKGGYTSIPWLELLDLRKWVLAEVQ